MAAQKRQDINLLPQREFESTTTGRILAWVLSSFRIIVIVTELIVMVAFLSRFWLDAQNSDLDDEIEQKQAVLTASRNFEKEFKDTQERLGVYKEYTSQNIPVSELLREITKSLADNVSLNQINLTKDKIELKASSTNENSIQKTIINLAAKERFKEVNLKDITTDKDNPNLINFGVEILSN